MSLIYYDLKGRVKLTRGTDFKGGHEMNIQEKLMHIQQEIKATKDLRNDFGRFNYRNA